ncbi:MAG: hypothetical protein EXS05_06005 [Planctomycetaceae bacterium]|nr:hypothetical protein [Planctomycetaceae bacterium]
MPATSLKPVTLEQLVALNDEIAGLVRAGVPLELGLRGIGSDKGWALGRVSAALAQRLQTGESLPDALRAEKDSFPPVYRTIVEAGLRAGRLPAALEAMSNFGRELVELRRQIGAALVYPLIVFALAYGLFLVFTIDMLQRFRETYNVFRIPLHGPLRLMVWLADRVWYWWWIPPAILAGAVLWWISTRGAHILSFAGSTRPLRWIPGIGRIGRNFQYANFAELLALLIEHEIPLGEGLRLSADATCDTRLQQAAGSFAAAIEQGQVSPAPVHDSRDFPLLLEWCLWPIPWLISCFITTPPAFPPFLHWVLWQASGGAAPARLLRHAAGIYRRRAATYANWFKFMFPVFAALVIGGGVTIVYALALFGPLATFWRDLVN